MDKDNDGFDFWEAVEIHSIANTPDGVTADDAFKILKEKHPNLKHSEFRNMIAASIKRGDIRISKNGKMYA